MTRDVRKRAVAAIKAGRVAFAVPGASKCMPTRAGKPPEITAGGFGYVTARLALGCVVFSWGYPGVGFGELWIGEQHGEWQADTEGMGPDFCAKMLEAWVRGIVKPEIVPKKGKRKGKR